MNRIIFIDWNSLLFRNIFASCKAKFNPGSQTVVMLLRMLRMVEVRPEDTVIIACDSPDGSWRRELDTRYKEDRKRRREQRNVDWTTEFKRSKHILNLIQKYSPFHVILVPMCEADDVISYGCRKFSKQECIIVSTDSDFEQLYYFPNVKMFSPISQNYKQVKNPLKVLDQKTEKERSDNLTAPIVSDQDYLIRRTIVNLLKLPDDIETRLEEEYKNLPEKKFVIGNLPYAQHHELWARLYDNESVTKTKRKKKKHYQQLTFFKGDDL
jgi:5'-3' exonuclease